MVWYVRSTCDALRRQMCKTLHMSAFARCPHANLNPPGRASPGNLHFPGLRYIILDAPMTTPQQFDAIVIGSGQAGTPLSTALAEAGMRTALIEREHVGGTCVNEGCTPTKTMVASARVAYLARRGADYGVHTGDIRIDMERVRQRKRDIVNSFRNGSQGRIEKTANLELIFGEASFTGAGSLLVRQKDGGQRVLTAKKIFINAGARPSVPALDGLKYVPYLDSTSIMELD